MGLDLDLIKKRVQELSGIKKTSSIQMWKPGPGEYRVRGLLSHETKDGMPFVERWFYYFTNPGILSPKQFGKQDPIDDFIRKLYASGKPEDKQMANTLRPKMRVYMPIIVRGEEEKGVQIWSFGKILYQRFLSFFNDEEVGDILDPNTGFDLKVVVSKTAGKTYQDMAVDPARKSSKLSDDPEAVKLWLSSMPSIDDMWKLKSPQEIDNILTKWLNGDLESPADTSTGTVKSEKSIDTVAAQIDNLAAELTATSKKVEVKKPKKSVSDVSDELDKPIHKKSLDEAFEELMSEED
jgi:hypothetical protein